MFQPWRIKLREAQTALRSGRLDEAGRRRSRPWLGNATLNRNVG